MSEERFFNQVKQTMAGYTPEVPQQVYGKMRRALWRSNFTRVSATRFNMWYLLLLLGAGGGTTYALYTGEVPARAMEQTSAPVVNHALEVETLTLAVDPTPGMNSSVSCSTSESVSVSTCRTSQPTIIEEVVAQPETLASGEMIPGTTPVSEGTAEVTHESVKPEEMVIAEPTPPAKKKKGRGLDVGIIKDKK